MNEQPLRDIRRQLAEELTGNILPWWMQHAVDEANGGFYGAISNDLQVHDEEPRSAILCARILWTYAAAYRALGEDAYLAMARHALDYLLGAFWDDVHGGLYWSVDVTGSPVVDRKHHYAQAFGIYGLTEFYRATKEPRALARAQDLYLMLEEHAFDPVHGGYIEGSARSWDRLDDMRLSERDMDCRKSMNTLLHILEAYTNLLRVWEDQSLRDRHRALIEVFHGHVIDERTAHFRLFFEDDWTPLDENVSYGHDIEGSWLLCEAAEQQGNESLVALTRHTAVRMAEAVLREGVDEDGGIYYESGPDGLVDSDKSWWVQAEAMVGFTNAFQISGQQRYERAAGRSWQYIQDHVIDRTHGDWFKKLDKDSAPDLGHVKAGPWECPYHHARACMEVMARLPAEQDRSAGCRLR